MKGILFDIKRFSIHDGPGIRTTVFFKGCPLRCWWCHNPESQSPHMELSFDADRCLGCLACADVCKSSARQAGPSGMEIDHGKCDECHECAQVCPTEALVRLGFPITPDEITERVLADRMFYEESGGGVTFSGGEPLNQGLFLMEVLKRLSVRNIHTALDTSGYADWKTLEATAAYTDLYLYDVKHMDPERHKAMTGVGNELILDNLRRLSKLSKEIWIRMPVIPGWNDSESNLRMMTEFMVSSGLNHVSLLPYHGYAKGKYARLGTGSSECEITTRTPTKAELETMRQIFEERGITVQIGG